MTKPYRNFLVCEYVVRPPCASVATCWAGAQTTPSGALAQGQFFPLGFYGGAVVHPKFKLFDIPVFRPV